MRYDQQLMADTLIELQHPYSADWRKAYLNINSDGRRTLTLYNSDDDRSSTQYARYLLAVKLGRYLTKDETVDHIDDDKTNDDVSNLQLMSMVDNLKKRTVYLEGLCFICGTTIKRAKGSVRPKARQIALIQGQSTCGRECRSIKTSRTLKNV
ncbi:hypothetical protein NVP1026O_077 [Vibrio phage 1.026.O._10N.222.49.C7]|uniref:HNH nuclease domain-containing protein n=1 Tax=Vibrio phage 1.026.O._10N.222.49.C7 TaxID=1881421 RepID=A0A2I7QMP8_9CAUD|nr:HNH endonuclease [Vibrio phage 1.026.O._10N.222.49.C7]AUR82668.1 hypothetical protein NVP1026O_077 [Vibrio phage 1.026.O._10N.222.49.C7]